MWKYDSYTHHDAVQLTGWTKKPIVWQAAFERLQGEIPVFPETLLHRDFHPANVLCLDDEVSGVVDWSNACRGPAGIDVGHCRVNLALLYGVTGLTNAMMEERMDTFVEGLV